MDGMSFVTNSADATVSALAVNVRYDIVLVLLLSGEARGPKGTVKETVHSHLVVNMIRLPLL